MNDDPNTPTLRHAALAIFGFMVVTALGMVALGAYLESDAGQDLAQDIRESNATMENTTSVPWGEGRCIGLLCAFAPVLVIIAIIFLLGGVLRALSWARSKLTGDDGGGSR